MKNKRDLRGLVAALRYRSATAVRKSAALALAELANIAPGLGFEATIPPLIAVFEDNEPTVVNAAVQALSNIGQPALLALVSALRAPGEKTREASARAIGRISSSLAETQYLKLTVDPLVACLRDSAMSVRRASAWALGRISMRLDPGQRVLPVDSLILALRDPAPEVREAAAASLGRSNEGRAIRPLIASLEDESAAVRKIASEALDGLGWSPTNQSENIHYRIARQEWSIVIENGQACLPSLLRLLEGNDASLRQATVQTLGKLGSSEVIGPLVNALKDSDEGVRMAAAAALEQAGAPQAIDALLMAIRDKDRAVRKAVTMALAHTHDERAAVPILNMLRNRDVAMYDTAAAALIKLGSPAVPYLVLMLSEPDSTLQELVSQILWKIGSPAVMTLTSMLREARPPANRLAAEILGEIGDARAVWPLISVLPVNDLTVPAAQALGKIGDVRAVKPLMEMLVSSYSEQVQQATALALGSIGDPLALDTLIRLLRNGEHQVRVEAAKALLKMYRSGKLDMVQKQKILDHRDQITEKHTDTTSHQDEAHGADWHTDQSFHEDTGIGLEFPGSIH